MTNNIEVIRGTTEQCLKHFSKTRQRLLQSNNFEVLSGIAKLLGISPITGQQWLNQDRTPQGVNYLKLQLFLELAGYHLIEWENFADPVKSLKDILALAIINPEDVAKQLSVDEGSVMRWVQRKRIPAPERIEPITSIVTPHKTVGDVKKQEWLEAIEKLGVRGTVLVEGPAQVNGAIPTSNPTLSASSILQNGINEHEQAIEVLGHLILAAKPLAARILTDEFTPEERQSLRDLTTKGRSNGLFELSNLLNRLCGERARNEIR
jgi:hypothetical protein